MILIILSGDNKKYNIIWNKKIKNSLKSNFNIIEDLHYKHWENFNQETIDLNLELRSLVRLLKGHKDYIICAKTAGVLVTLKGIYEKKLRPKQCIFIGLPMIWARLNNFEVDKWIDGIKNIPTLIIQKDKDPSMYYEDLQIYLNGKKISNVNMQKIPGRDMYYEDYKVLKTIINNYITESVFI